ncbi:hypothetical protein Afil01_59070 [Actinorhabdospora filicis]|uniref:Pentapeptide repeat-containing protein n=1 Tax=Actinorhabdospora filicis TaxID=1785913 RepID=A0A9W6SQH8_9ACTN|nr:pentapeptide repeat-containing protein [Actinorhabdospora filicis]GLZ81100.1 hypothetical protein Afil01_59070 [Actinorhabdospora filicis]
MRVLSADCAQCFGLCCTAPAFQKSADFAIDKPANKPCPNLLTDSRCGIHAKLRDSGFRGCTVYDCFGAGQRLAQETFGGRDWRTDPFRRMLKAFPVMRDLHELLWYLREALAAAPTLREEIEAAYETTDALASGTPEQLSQVDVNAERDRVNAILRRASAVARGGGQDLAGSQFFGSDLRDAKLVGASLRGGVLIAADLRGADLTRADLTGADLRDADLRGANLSGALFCTQAQLDSARGDGRTRLPKGRTRPGHWA